MRTRRVLYISSSIGLGHVSKDLAIAGELRRLDPALDIVWIAGEPAADVLREAGEHVLPEATRWRGASAIAERCVRDGRLDLVRYVYRSLPAWAANASLFRDVVRTRDVDIVVGNEAYEIDIPLILRLLHPPVPFVMVFDFVGTDPMTGALVDRAGSWFLNALWSRDGSVYGRPPHSAVFIGELDDIPSSPLGFALPGRRDHARRFYDAVGHVVRFSPAEYSDPAERRARRHALGFGDGPLVVCAAGGTAVGRALIEMCAAAAVPLGRLLPGVHVVLVCGPRIRPESIRAPAGVEVRGYVPRLHELFACCDAAVVQCGASSTTELAALRTPFVYFPVEGHFEQEVVAARLSRYGVGTRLSLQSTSAESLARAIRDETLRAPPAAAMPLDGAAGAAHHIVTVLDGGRPGTRAV